MFPHDASVRTLPKRERAKVEKAFASYLETIPRSKRFDRGLFYDLRDVVGSPASASAAPGFRRTTSWWRATARRSTTTSCCR